MKTKFVSLGVAKISRIGLDPGSQKLQIIIIIIIIIKWYLVFKWRRKVDSDGADLDIGRSHRMIKCIGDSGSVLS